MQNICHKLGNCIEGRHTDHINLSPVPYLTFQEKIKGNMEFYIHAAHLGLILLIPVVVLGIWTSMFSLRMYDFSLTLQF